MFSKDHRLLGNFLAKQKINELHDSYLEEKMEPMVDVKYICRIYTTVCARILEKEETALYIC